MYEHVTSIATILLKFQERQMSCQMLLFISYGRHVVARENKVMDRSADIPGQGARSLFALAT